MMSTYHENFKKEKRVGISKNIVIASSEKRNAHPSWMKIYTK
jgi:hypothetical protein